MTSWFAPRLQSASGGLLLLALCLLSPPPAGAKGPGNDPAALVAKMESLYTGAKSFQGTITMRRSGKTRDGKTFAIAETREVRYKAPNLIFDNQRIVGTGAAVRESARSAVYVGDGKTLYVYAPSSNQYAKRGIASRVMLKQMLGRYLIIAPRFTLSIGTAAKVNGRDAFVIVAKPKIPTEFPPNVRKEDQPKIIAEIKMQRPTQVFIDKRTYQLLRVTGGSNLVNDEVNFVSQTLNGAIASGAFTFRAPAGAKLFTQPAGTPNPLPNAIK